MRYKQQDIPNQNKHKSQEDPRAKARFASKRADGSINTHPQERMKASNERTE